ncbi:MAG: hypothetical protein LBI45_03140 [Bacteroidales bacterium]|jgi:hypothetical protein|nr:hypothetical protein [Bacteroidales bacterium]
MRNLLIFVCFLGCVTTILAQEIEVGEAEMEVITIKEQNFFIGLNSSGFCVGFQQGKTPNAKDKYLWEIEFLYSIHHKAVLGRLYVEGRSYCFGKLYDLFFLRSGYGYQRIITHKPYYGGVQIRYFVSGGASICFGLPTFLEIIKEDSIQGIYTEIERYNPELHNSVYDILGASPFINRFHKIAVRPGFYAKAGLNFDFSKNPLKLQMLEVGVSIDMIFPFIQQMAFNRTKPFYFCGYVAYSFGKKKPRYEFE